MVTLADLVPEFTPEEENKILGYNNTKKIEELKENVDEYIKARSKQSSRDAEYLSDAFNTLKDLNKSLDDVGQLTYRRLINLVTNLKQNKQFFLNSTNSLLKTIGEDIIVVSEELKELQGKASKIKDKGKEIPLDLKRKIGDKLGEYDKLIRQEAYLKQDNLGSVYDATIREIEKKISEKKKQENLDNLTNPEVWKEKGGGVFKYLTGHDLSPEGIWLTTWDLAKRTSEQVKDIRKNLNLGFTEADRLRESFLKSALSSGDVALNIKDFTKALGEVSSELGVTVTGNKEFNEQITKANKGLALSSTETGTLAQYVGVSGKSAEALTDNILGVVTNVGLANGQIINANKSLKEALSITGELRANFKGNIEDIAKATAQATLYGTSLKDVDAAGKTLLDFQSSIQNQLEAELLTHKNINLERARAAALAGRTDIVADELVKIAGSWEDFTKLNVLQRESLAKSLGYSSDQLSDMLFKQTALNKLSAYGSGSELERYKALKASGATLAQQNTLLGEAVRKQLETSDVAEKWGAFVENIKDAFASAFSGQTVENLSKIIKLMADAVNSMLPIIKFISYLLPTISGAWAGAKLGSFFGPQGTAIGAVAGGLFGLGTSLYGSYSNQGNDVLSNYGKRTLITPEGAYSLNNNDTVLAGTRLNRANDLISAPAGTFGGDNTLTKKMEELTRTIVELSRRPIELQVNGGTIQKWNTAGNVFSGNTFYA